jgi:uncharacterized protein (TIRG00374 family)
MKKIVVGVQWVVTLLLILAIASNVSLADLKHAFAAASLFWLVVALFQLLFQFPLAALRWLLLVRRLDGKISFYDSLSMIWTGAFFSQLLPSSIGGDAARLLFAWRAGLRLRIAVNSIGFDRLIMLVVLSFLLLLTSNWMPPAIRSGPLVVAAGAIFLGAIAMTVVIAVSDRLLRSFTGYRIVDFAIAMAADIRRLSSDIGFMAVVTFISFISYLNLIATAWLVSLALHVDISLWNCLMLFPAVFFVSSLPISVSGWGIREAAIVSLFGAIGIPAPSALVVSLVFGFVSIAASLPGAVMWRRAVALQSAHPDVNSNKVK